jgi:cell division control protein 6
MTVKNIFEEELKSGKKIFLNKAVLSPHYVPKELPHREREVREITKIIAPVLRNEKPDNMFIYGKTGTGKTCVVKYVLGKLDEFVNDQKKNVNNAVVKSIYMNCKIRNSKYQVLLNTLEDEALNSSPLKNTPLEDRTDNTLTGIDPANLYDRLYKVVEKNSLSLILVLDEIDMISKGLNDLIYLLTRINDDLRKGNVSLIGMSNDIRVMRRLDPRTKSTLCQEERIFKPYNAPELETILTQRINAGFLPGTISKDVILRIAAFAAQDGDARYALRLLKKSGELAEESGKGRVTMEEAEKAKSAVEEDIMAEAISTLPEHQQIVIYSIASLASKGGMYKRLSGVSGEGGGDLFTGEVYEAYQENCKALSRQPRTSRQVSEYLNELEMLGLITTKISGKGVRGTTRLIRLGYPPDEIKAIVKKGLGLE